MLDKLKSRIGSPEFWWNVTVAAGVPGALAYTLAKALGRRPTAADRKFEQQVAELVKAESPVINIDPHLDDTDKETEIRGIGLARKAAVDPFKQPWETGTLIALAYLASLYGWRKGQQSVVPAKLEQQNRTYRQLMNELEASEHERLFQQSDPEGWMASRGVAKAAAADEAGDAEARTAVRSVPHMSMAEAIDAIEAGPLLAKKAIGPLAIVAAALGLGAAFKFGGQVFDTTKDTAKAGARAANIGAGWAYPPLALALLLGSGAAGKTLADRRDPARARLKGMKEVLEEELMLNQSPAILEVGSDLPWEKARHLPPDQLSGDVIPEDLGKVLVREKREIRI